MEVGLVKPFRLLLLIWMNSRTDEEIGEGVVSQTASRLNTASGTLLTISMIKRQYQGR